MWSERDDLHQRIRKLRESVSDLSLHSKLNRAYDVSVAGFYDVARRYIREVEDAQADNPR